METLETVLLICLIADAVALGALVLLQQGKGADIGAAFGAGGANTVFGSSGSASFLTKLTTWLAIGFFVIAFGLAYTAKEKAALLQGLGIPQVPLHVAPRDEMPLLEDQAPALPVVDDALDSDIPDV